MENTLQTPTVQQIEKLRTEFESRRTQAAIAASKVAEIEKQMSDDFGVTIEQVPQKLNELQQAADAAREQLQEEYGEFNEIWSAIMNSSAKNQNTPSPVTASDW